MPTSKPMGKQRVAVIPGDGIGPEIMDATIAILEATGFKPDWVYLDAGLSAIEKGKDPMPQETIDAVREIGVALKGPTTTPSGTGHVSANVRLRKALDLYANVRPAKTMPGIKGPFAHMDVDIISDLCAGLVGGLGLAPGANIGKECAVFEAVHGSAPDIAGKGIANPTALLLSSLLMLRYLGHTEQADTVKDSVLRICSEGKCLTKDLGGNANTDEYRQEVISLAS